MMIGKATINKDIIHLEEGQGRHMMKERTVINTGIVHIEKDQGHGVIRP